MPALQEITIPIAADADCRACAERLREGISVHKGIAEVTPREHERSLSVRFDPELCSAECLEAATTELRLGFGQRFSHEVMPIEGMDCYDCAQTIERAMGRLAGVSHADVNFAVARMRVEYEPALVGPAELMARVEKLGYRVGSPGSPAGGASAGSRVWWRGRDARTALSATLLALALALDLGLGLDRPGLVAYALAVVIGGWSIARSGLATLRATLRPDINLLMSIAVVGATAIGAWIEAALVVVLFSVGESLEGRAVERARRELAGLLSLTPETARVRPGHRRADGAGHHEEIEIPAADLVVGDEVVVRPGERIAADGRVVEGASTVDQAAITGESTPVDKVVGDTTFAGTLNAQGRLVIEVTSAPGDTTLDKIGRLVADAQARRSPSERWVDSFARVYTPVVILVAALVAGVSLAFGVAPHQALYAALALLILACPCALVISTPVAIVSALGRASAAGVLVKGGAHLEKAATLTAVAFDKTGTLTGGRPTLTVVDALGGDENEVLGLAASIEQGSEHPLARAILATAATRGVRLAPIGDFEALVGLGARGRVGGDLVEIGSPRMFGTDRLDAQVAEAIAQLHASGQTVVVVAREGRPFGLLGLADVPRPEAAEAIADLGRLGIDRTILLTGDNAAAAQAIAQSVGVSQVRASLLPGDKAEAIAGLGGVVAMVGDGVNDAPALAGADLGIAMGSAGSDAAVEVADVALMGDDPRKVAGLIGLARWSRAVVRQNVTFALATKLAALGLLVAGALPLWAAVASDVGASLVVVANGLRLLRGSPFGRMRGLPILRPAPARAAASRGAQAAATTLPPLEEDGCADACCSGGSTAVPESASVDTSPHDPRLDSPS